MAHFSETTRTIGTAMGWKPGKEFGFITPEDGGVDVFITFEMVRDAGFRPEDFTKGVELDFEYRTLADGKRRVTTIHYIAGTNAADAAFIFQGQFRKGVVARQVDNNKKEGKERKTLFKLSLGSCARYAVEQAGKVRLLPPMSLVEARDEIGRHIEAPKTAPGVKTNVGGVGHVKGPSPAADSGKGRAKKAA